MAREMATRTGDPAVEPVTLTEVKDHLRVTDTASDTWLTTHIKAAREYAEEFIQRSMITQTWRVTLTGFPTSDVILLPRPPLQSVTSVAYIDTDGASQTFVASSYNVLTDPEPGMIELKTGQSWPGTESRQEAVTITYVAGYGPATTDVPERLRLSIMQLVGHWFINREATTKSVASFVRTVPLSSKWLLWPERMSLIG